MALHFDFSPDQRMLADSLRRVLADGKGTTLPEIAVALARQGVFEVMLGEDHGGLGLGLTDALVLSIEIGRAGVDFPASETMLAVPLVARLRPDVLADALEGRAIVTMAASGQAKAARERDHWRLSGEVWAPFARETRLVAVPVGEGRATVIDLTARGVTVEEAVAFDPAGPMASVRFDLTYTADAIVADPLSMKAAVLACGEMTGAAEVCLERGVQHLRERVQFDKPLGANQVLRHAVADDWLRVQGMQAACEYAAAAFDLAQEDAAHAASVAKAYCSQAGRKVAESTIHIHGGMGFTWDAGLHLPLRRIMRLAASYGTAGEHFDSIARDLVAANTERKERPCSSKNFASM
jgi:alkylation response protein AidB-like acyl-CoA dehydrogenase